MEYSDEYTKTGLKKLNTSEYAILSSPFYPSCRQCGKARDARMK